MCCVLGQLLISFDIFMLAIVGENAAPIAVLLTCWNVWWANEK